MAREEHGEVRVQPGHRRTIEAKYQQYRAALKPVAVDPPKRPKAASVSADGGANRAAEFAIGVGEGGYAVAKGTAKAIYSAATTNPATTIGEIGRGIADKIDRAIAAEDTPARVHLSEAAKSITNASARDIGRAVGSTAANAALAVVPGAAATKVSALRRARVARPRRTYHMPEIGWAKETHRSKEPWVPYNDSAPGARPGLAPTLEREKQGRSRSFVKFDGIRGDYMIDRKWSVSNQRNAVAQMLRQSDVLRRHHLIGVWEVRNQQQRRKALRMFKRYHVTNIYVRIVEP